MTWPATLADLDNMRGGTRRKASSTSSLFIASIVSASITVIGAPVRAWSCSVAPAVTTISC